MLGTLYEPTKSSKAQKAIIFMVRISTKASALSPLTFNTLGEKLRFHSFVQREGQEKKPLNAYIVRRFAEERFLLNSTRNGISLHKSGEPSKPKAFKAFPFVKYPRLPQR